MKVTVARARSDASSEPNRVSYEVPVQSSWSILDVLGYIKDHLDPTLSWRQSCRMGICGSCGMRVDGRPVLACETFVHELSSESVSIEPLAHLPVQRDLIVDTSPFLDHLAAVRPWLHPTQGATGPVGEQLQTPEQQEPFWAAAQCIGCMICISACPQSGLSESFLGPAALAVAHRYLSDSRDGGHQERQDPVQSEDGVWGCTLVGSCSAVCPKGVDPASAIQLEKVRGALSWVSSWKVRR
jgi:fumarate reductase iron-sulfur subunit